MVESFGDYVKSETLSLELLEGSAPEGAYTKDWELNGEPAKLGVKKV